MHLISFASYHISDNIYEADEHLWHDVKHFTETYLMNGLCVLVGDTLPEMVVNAKKDNYQNDYKSRPTLGAKVA